GRARETALFSDSNEVTELMNLHGKILVRLTVSPPTQVVQKWSVKSGISGITRDGARNYACATMGALAGAEVFFVRRFIASCNSSTSKGFARNISTFNSS